MCAILLIAAFSCKEDESDYEPDLGYSYFPTEIGSYITYRADSIFHDNPTTAAAGIHDTISYYIKEVVESEVLDALEEPAMRIVRYKRDTPDDAWELRDVWMAKTSSRNAEKVEENRRYVKLAFPISATSEWDGNALNDLEEWRYSYDSIGYGRDFDTLSFEQTVFVNQRQFLTEVNDERAYEIYAKGVGLIYRYHKQLFTRPSYLNNRVAENIISGNEFRWEVTDYGME